MRRGRARRDSNSGGWMRARSSGRLAVAVAKTERNSISSNFADVVARFAPSLSRHVSTARVPQRGAAEQEGDRRVRRGLCAVSSFLQVKKRSECGGAHVHVERSVRATRIYRLPSSIASFSTIIVVIKGIESEREGANRQRATTR